MDEKKILGEILNSNEQFELNQQDTVPQILYDCNKLTKEERKCLRKK